MKTKKQYVNTVWRVRTYDVWGNAKDGYGVNDVYGRGTVELRLLVRNNNADRPELAFQSASPTDKQIRAALGIRRFRLDIQGDDLVIYVNRDRDGYPLGELQCESHDSLSPIREKGVKPC